MRYEAAWLVAAVAGICVLAADVGLRVEPWATSGANRGETKHLGHPDDRAAGEAHRQTRSRLGAAVAPENRQTEPTDDHHGAEQRDSDTKPAVGHDVGQDDDSGVTHWVGLLSSLATVLIVPLTVWLAYVGYRQARSGEIAADAAKGTAGLLMAQEAPLLTFKFCMLQQGQFDPYSLLAAPFPRIDFCFTNHGRTVAFCRNYSIEAGLDDNQPLISNASRVLKSNVVPAGQSTPPLEFRLFGFPNVDLAALNAREITMWFKGEINYADVFGTEKRTSFRYTFDPATQSYLEDFSIQSVVSTVPTSRGT